jgi:hypothetical protein
MTEQERDLKVIHLQTLMYMTEQEAALQQMLIILQCKIARFQALTGAGSANA